jgi:hypothetical protein
MPWNFSSGEAAGVMHWLRLIISPSAGEP